MDSLFINLIGEQFGLDLKLGHRVPRGDRSSSQLTVTKLCQLLDWKKTSIIVQKKRNADYSVPVQLLAFWAMVVP